MKVVRNIISTILVLAVINTISTKAIHELFEHNAQIHTCVHKDITHFHSSEFHHLDLICDFNFSSSLVTDFILNFKNVIFYKENQVKVQALSLLKNLYLKNLLLRGPPSIK